MLGGLFNKFHKRCFSFLEILWLVKFSKNMEVVQLVLFSKNELVHGSRVASYLTTMTKVYNSAYFGKWLSTLGVFLFTACM